MDKKFFFQTLGLIILILGATALTFNPQLIPNLGSKATTAKPSATTTGQTYAQVLDASSNQVKANVLVEIANTKQTRALGLGNRASLPSDNGMLFIMEQRAKPTFWMKNMLIPLDMIWIDGDKIADIIANIPPPIQGQADPTLPVYSPTKDVDKVLEVNAGYVAAHGIQIGDQIKLVTVAPSP